VHISEGILSGPVLIAGAALAVGGVAAGLKRMDPADVPKVAVLSSAFFVASLIHVPIGPGNVHLVLNGITGLLLGWAAFPAILVGITLQALLFQFGGLTSLGVNTFVMAFPAVVVYHLLSPLTRSHRAGLVFAAGCACGSVAILLSGVLVALALVSTSESFSEVAGLVLLAHLPIMIVEGLLTAFCLTFLKRVKPELLNVPRQRRAR